MKARSFVAVAILLLASGAFVTSCGSEDKRQVSDSSDKSGEGGAEAQEKNNSGDSGGGGVFPAARATATIKGHVVYDGKLPRRLKTPISGIVGTRPRRSRTSSYSDSVRPCANASARMC